MKKNIILGLFLSATFLIGILVWPLIKPQPAAAIGLAGFSFGGKVTGGTLVCTNGVAILVAGTKPGYYLITATTIQKPFYNYFKPGVNVLGTAMPSGFCWVGLTPVPMVGTATQIGTSAL